MASNKLQLVAACCSAVMLLQVMGLSYLQYYVALSLGPDPKDELACKPIRRYIDLPLCKSIKNVCFLVQLQVRSAVIVERHADQMTYFRKPWQLLMGVAAPSQMYQKATHRLVVKSVWVAAHVSITLIMRYNIVRVHFRGLGHKTNPEPWYNSVPLP